MSEGQAVKRGPGRPKRVVEPAPYSLDTESVKLTTISNPDASNSLENVQTMSQSPAKLPLDSEAKSRIAVCNDVKIVCRGSFGRKDFDASGLKDDLTALPKAMVTPEFVGTVKLAQSVELVCKVRKVSKTMGVQGETMSATAHDASWLKEWV